MIIKTNHNRREIIDAYQLTESERKEFDYLDWPAIDEGRDSASFFRYRGMLYDLGSFTVDTAPEGWDAAYVDSFFSAIVVRHVREDCEDLLIVGLALS